MGLFSSKKKTYVSSVVYNLSGDEEDRVDFIQSTSLSCAITGNSLGQAIVDGIMYGQAAKINAAYRYAVSNYSEGMPRTNIMGITTGDVAALTAAIQAEHPNHNVVYVTTAIGPANFIYWAEQYLAEKYGYDRISGNFDSPPSGVGFQPAVTYDIAGNRIRITLLGNGNRVTDTFTPVGWKADGVFAHAIYRTSREYVETDNVVTRDVEPGDSAYVQFDQSSVTVADETYTYTTQVTATIVDDKFKTHTRTDVQVLSRSKYFMYELGKGTHPALDALVSRTALMSPYVPAVPLRQDNQDMFHDSQKPTIQYKTRKRLLKHMGIDVNKLVDQVNDNENIKDIDYAFVVLGVALNSQTRCGKAYLYSFFETLMNDQKFNKAVFDAWNARTTESKNKVNPSINTLEYFNGTQSKHNYTVKIQWNYISKTLVSGVIGEVGTITSTIGTQGLFTFSQAAGEGDSVLDMTNYYLRKQITEDTYEKMTVSGLVYDNMVYNNKSVTVTAYEAFNMPEDEGEGFIIPLNMDAFRAMRPLDRTQLSYECNYMVFNCYKVVKKKWYQRGFFKVILVIAAIVITYFTAGAGSYTMAMATAIGSAIAVSATVALIIASTITVLAGIVLGSLLSKGAVKLFGEKWGRVIATIVTIVLTRQAAGSGIGGAANSTTQITAQTVIQALGAVQKVYSAYTEGAMVEMQDEMKALREKYDKDMKRVENLMKELQGNGNMFQLEDYMIASERLTFESPDDFLARTLMVGSDVVDITLGLVDNYTEVGLSLDPSA